MRGGQAGEGFPHDCLGLREAGSLQNGVPEGGERHTTAEIPILPTGTSAGRPLQKSPEAHPAHTLGDRASPEFPPRGLHEPPPAARRPE